jgi:hypothetical protein
MGKRTYLDFPNLSCPASYSLTKDGCPICPAFLRRLVALIHSMRLSLMKGAYADLSGTAWQEIGVKPSFGLSGMPLLFPSDFQFIRRTQRSGGSHILRNSL